MSFQPSASATGKALSKKFIVVPSLAPALELVRLQIYYFFFMVYWVVGIIFFLHRANCKFVMAFVEESLQQWYHGIEKKNLLENLYYNNISIQLCVYVCAFHE